MELSMRRLLVVSLVVAACNPSAVKKGDPLHAYVGTEYYLAMPLSGPKFRNSNMFGQKPFLDAGTKVHVLSVERVDKSFHSDWLVSPDEIHALEPIESLRIYRIYFDGPEVCSPHPCEANWRLLDDAAFEKRFEKIFVHEDPLAGIPPKRLALIRKHQVASWMTPEDVVRSFGEPNFVISSVGVDRWIYEERVCDYSMRLLGIPKLELRFAGRELLDHEKLSRTDFYVVLEPRGNLSVCYDPKLDTGPTVVQINASGAPVGVSGWGPNGAEQFSRLPLSRQLGILSGQLYPPARK